MSKNAQEINFPESLYNFEDPFVDGTWNPAILWLQDSVELLDSLNANLFFASLPGPVDFVLLIGPFKPYLPKKDSPWKLNIAPILTLAATVVLFANEARYTQI